MVDMRTAALETDLELQRDLKRRATTCSTSFEMYSRLEIGV